MIGRRGTTITRSGPTSLGGAGALAPLKTSPRRAAARLLAAAVIGAGMALPAGASPAPDAVRQSTHPDVPLRELHLRYEITAGGIEAVSFATDIALEPGGYSMSTEAETVGVVGFFYPWRMEARSEGEIVQGVAVQPLVHRADSTWRNHRRTVFLDYAPDGHVEATVQPSAAADDREKVPAELRMDTLDPMTAVLSAITAFDRDETCDYAVPVFDGRRRYDLVLRDGRNGAPMRHGLSLRLPRLYVCQVGFRRIAGFWRKDGGEKGMYPNHGWVWMARVFDDMPPVPVKVEYEGRFGLVEIHLAEATDGARHRRLPVEPEARVLGLF
jgi:hypothetical protein